MSSNIIIEELEDVDAEDRVATDRADYTQEQTINVSTTIQQERIATISRSKTTPISSGSENAYSTGWLAVGDFNKVIGTLFADQACTIYVEQSTDGENVDSSQSQSYTANATDYSSGGGVFSLELTAPYCRVRVVATTTTTVFRFWTRLSMGA